MNQKLTMAGVLAAVLIGALFSPSQAEQSSQVIYACTTPKNGTVMRVSTSPVTCPPGTTPIQWGAGSIGPQGEKGATGPQGPKGEKGQPGLTYGEAMASGNDENSAIWSLINQPGCLGPGFVNLNEGSYQYCARQFSGVHSIQILSVVITSEQNSYKGYAHAGYILKSTCPSTWSATNNAINTMGPITLLAIDGMKPVSYSVDSDQVCLIWNNSSMNGNLKSAQIIGTTN